MRRDCIGAEQLAEMMCDTLGHPARVDEDQRGAVCLNQFREPMINFLPNFIRHHGFQR